MTAEDELVEHVAIGLFAVYDNLSIEDAERNWREGYAYGCVGSDAHREIMKEAAVVAQALANYHAAKAQEQPRGMAETLVSHAALSVKE